MNNCRTFCGLCSENTTLPNCVWGTSDLLHFTLYISKMTVTNKPVYYSTHKPHPSPFIPIHIPPHYPFHPLLNVDQLISVASDTIATACLTSCVAITWSAQRANCWCGIACRATVNIVDMDFRIDAYLRQTNICDILLHAAILKINLHVLYWSKVCFSTEMTCSFLKLSLSSIYTVHSVW